MKNLLLIGDSIRMGYDKSVKKTLEGKANVIFPEENCRFASYVLRYFHEYLKDIKGEDIDISFPKIRAFYMNSNNVFNLMIKEVE